MYWLIVWQQYFHFSLNKTQLSELVSVGTNYKKLIHNLSVTQHIHRKLRQMQTKQVAGDFQMD